MMSLTAVQISELTAQFFLAAAGTLSFAILFACPRRCLPLVPGAGIYYTAYYFIQNENALALAKGISTFKIAVALAIGISLVLCVPLPKRK